MRENRQLTTLARIALLVTAGDLATKAAAKELLSSEATWFAPWLHFAVIHNDQGAFGWTVGAYTWQLNLALTLAAIAFMIPVTRDLSRVDPRAPTALGLIVGGALGNLASLVTSPYGVVDFIQIDLERHGVALNVADIAAYAGLAMILRTGGLLVAALRREVRLREPRRTTAVRSVFAEKAQLSKGLRAGLGAGLEAGLEAGMKGDTTEGVRSGGRTRSASGLPKAGHEVVVMEFDRVGRPSASRGDMTVRSEREVEGPGIGRVSKEPAATVRLRRDGPRRVVVGEIAPRLEVEETGGERLSRHAEPGAPRDLDR
ncbi:MAG: signal peptidase II [Gemmatimonadetes bacterium]|nr:signal peptidase II [Gemmatimonadota bacterium]MCC6774359.1 signal peptidase II [Gemmatimonadaceae bacterium]